MTPSDKRKKIEESEELSALANDLDDAKALEDLASSDGGRLLTKGLLDDMVSTMESFSTRYKEATMQEFIGWGAELNKMLEIYRSLQRAKDAKKNLKEALEKALSE